MSRRRETAAADLKAAGIAIRAPAGWGAARRQNRAAYSGLPRRRLRRYVYKLRSVATPEESSMHGN